MARRNYLQRVYNAAKSNTPSHVLRKDLWDYCVPLGERPIGVIDNKPQKVPIEGPTFAQRQDQFWEDNMKEKRRIEYAEYVEEESSSGTTVLLVGAAGVILFLLFKK